MLSKQEAAERLLVQAVKLQFSDGDPYAIHLLLMSSTRICRDVLKSKGVSDELERIIKPEYRKEFFSIFYSIASFFKHADRNLALLEIPPDLQKGNEGYIILVGRLVCDAFGVKNRNIFVYVAIVYYMRLYPDFFHDEDKYIYNQPFSAFRTNQLCAMIRTLVKEGPSFLGTQSWAMIGLGDFLKMAPIIAHVQASPAFTPAAPADPPTSSGGAKFNKARFNEGRKPWEPYFYPVPGYSQLQSYLWLGGTYDPMPPPLWNHASSPSY